MEPDAAARLHRRPGDDQRRHRTRLRGRGDAFDYALAGQITWISHGYHSPVVIRDAVRTGLLPCSPAHPLGTDLGIDSPSGEEFGLERFMDFVLTHNAEGLPVPETLRRLVHSVLAYQQGLHDDTTVLFTEWHGPHAARSDLPRSCTEEL